MAKCGQACPYNTLGGCKVKEYNAICPLTNMVTPITEHQMTNADRIRAMSDEELAKFLECFGLCHYCTEHHRLSDLRIYADEKCDEMCEQHCLEWLKQPAEE